MFISLLKKVASYPGLVPGNKKISVRHEQFWCIFHVNFTLRWIENTVTAKQGDKSSGTEHNLVKICRDIRDQVVCMTGVPPKTIHSALAASQDTLTRSDVYNRLFYAISGIIEGDLFRRIKWHVLALNCNKAPRDKHVLAVYGTPAACEHSTKELTSQMLVWLFGTSTWLPQSMALKHFARSKSSYVGSPE